MSNPQGVPAVANPTVPVAQAPAVLQVGQAVIPMNVVNETFTLATATPLQLAQYLFGRNVDNNGKVIIGAHGDKALAIPKYALIPVWPNIHEFNTAAGRAWVAFSASKYATAQYAPEVTADDLQDVSWFPKFPK